MDYWVKNSQRLEIEKLILWEDQHLLIVNKPAGAPVLPDGYHREVVGLKRQLEIERGPLWIVHRLDKETSGVLILARNTATHKALNIQFEKQQIRKSYHAIVVGNPNWEEKTVKAPLCIDGDHRHRTIVDKQGGKPSQTYLKILDRFEVYTLIEAIPHTGRTHQIRVHLAYVGHPIVCDRLYGDGQGVWLSQLKYKYLNGKDRERPLLGRLGLHAYSIQFVHPVTNELLYFQSNYPKDFRATLRQLNRCCG